MLYVILYMPTKGVHKTLHHIPNNLPITCLPNTSAQIEYRQKMAVSIGAVMMPYFLNTS